jgi:hypothetical protein
VLRKLLVLFISVLGCGTYSGSNISENKQDERGHGLLVAVESNPNNPGEKSTSTEFEVIRAKGDSTRLSDEEWEKLRIPDHGKGPNPFSPTTTIHFRISNEDSVRILMYDSKGIFVAKLFDAPLEAGTHLLKILEPEDWDIPAGVYFCVLETHEERRFVKKLLLLK